MVPLSARPGDCALLPDMLATHLPWRAGPADEPAQPAFTMALATQSEVITRTSALVGNAERVRNGAIEMTLDLIRRYLTGKPTDEPMDFERAK